MNELYVDLMVELSADHMFAGHLDVDMFMFLLGYTFQGYRYHTEMNSI